MKLKKQVKAQFKLIVIALICFAVVFIIVAGFSMIFNKAKKDADARNAELASEKPSISRYVPPQSCGDGLCNKTENATSCAKDCEINK
jgi:hypothetical protein